MRSPKSFIPSLVGALALAASVGSAHSLPLAWNFFGIVESGPAPLIGTPGSGAFGYEDFSILGEGGEELDPTRGLLLDFSILGVPYTQSNAAGFPALPQVSFIDGVPSAISYVLEDGVNDVDFDDPRIAAVIVEGALRPVDDGGSSRFAALASGVSAIPGEVQGVFRVSIRIVPHAVPEPATWALAGIAIAAGIAWRRRRR